jgi:hypothetical protein
MTVDKTKARATTESRFPALLLAALAAAGCAPAGDAAKATDPTSPVPAAAPEVAGPRDGAAAPPALGQTAPPPAAGGAAARPQEPPPAVAAPAKPKLDGKGLRRLLGSSFIDLVVEVTMDKYDWHATDEKLAGFVVRLQRESGGVTDAVMRRNAGEAGALPANDWLNRVDSPFTTPEERDQAIALLDAVFGRHLRDVQGAVEWEKKLEKLVEALGPAAAPALAAAGDLDAVAKLGAGARARLLASVDDPTSPYRLPSYFALRAKFPDAAVPLLPAEELLRTATDWKHPHRGGAIRDLLARGDDRIISMLLKPAAPAAKKADPTFLSYLEAEIAKRTGEIDKAPKYYDLRERAECRVRLAEEGREPLGNCEKAVEDCDAALRLLDGERKRLDVGPAGGAPRTTLERLQRDADAERRSDLHNSLADVYIQRGRALDRLCEHYRAVGNGDRASAAPNRALADYGQALLLASRTHRDRRVSQQTRVRRLVALGHRGRFLASLGQYEKALADFDELLTIPPVAESTFALRGDCLTALGRLKEAADSYGRAYDARRSQHQPSLEARFPEHRRNYLLDLGNLLLKQVEAYQKAGDKEAAAKVKEQIVNTLVDAR